MTDVTARTASVLSRSTECIQPGWLPRCTSARRETFRSASAGRAAARAPSASRAEQVPCAPRPILSRARRPASARKGPARRGSAQTRSAELQASAYPKLRKLPHAARNNSVLLFVLASPDVSASHAPDFSHLTLQTLVTSRSRYQSISRPRLCRASQDGVPRPGTHASWDHASRNKSQTL